MDISSRKYNIDDLDYLELLSDKSRTIGYLSEDGDEYIDIKNCCNFHIGNIKKHKIENVKVLGNLSKMIAQSRIIVLLLNSNGKINKTVNKDKVFYLLEFLDKISELDNLDDKVVIAKRVADLCVGKMKLDTRKKTLFRDLLQTYVLVEIIQQGAFDKKSSIVKNGQFIDYKVNRIIKYLNINVNLNEISDFSIEYNDKSIYIDGVEKFRIKHVTDDLHPKVNVIVRK
ncbi:MAG: hypothetical protein E7165_04370 [Firmicutes bacterium]|nr:hypothetical protein [Bacillota bacterium]